MTSILIGGQQSRSDCACPNTLVIETGTVIGKEQDDFISFLGQRQGNIADFRLASRHAFITPLQSVGNGVTQHVLERCRHLIKHAAVQFDLPPLDFQVGALVEFLRRLTNDAIQAIRQAAKRHHAYGHELLLDLSIQPCLRNDGRVGVVEVLEQVLLHGRHVVDRFGHHPCEFLEAREPVKLQGIEAGVFLIGHRGLRLHLRLGLNLDFPKLAAQTNDVFCQIQQRLLQAAHLTFDTRTSNREFARLIDQAVDNVGTDTKRGLLLQRLGIRLNFNQARTVRTSFDRYAIRGWLGGSLTILACNRLTSHAVPDRNIGLIQRFATLKTFNDLPYRFKRCFNFIDHFSRHRSQATDLIHPSFQCMGNFAKIHGTSHARATLQRVQKPLENPHRLTAGRIGPPRSQLRSDTLI